MRLSNLKTGTGKNANISVFVLFVLKRSYICYYIICMAVPTTEACNFIKKKRLCHRRFPVNFARLLRIPFLTEHPWWLLLNLSRGIFIKVLPNRLEHIPQNSNFSEHLRLCLFFLFFLKNIGVT